MSKEERLEMKLGMIYEQLFNINWKLEQMKSEKRKEEVEFQKINAERELEEIHYQENDYWNLKEKKMREFNQFNSEVECGRVVDNG